MNTSTTFHPDKIDRRLLELLQRDCNAPLADIAEQVNLSVTPCWRRIQRLEKEGYIKRRVALLDAEKLNVGVTVFVLLKTNRHSVEWYSSLQTAISLIPEVVEFYRLSGSVDYLLRIVVPDIKHYDQIYQKLIRNHELLDVCAGFSMEQIKSTTMLPMDYL